jgi:dipeptidase D
VEDSCGFHLATVGKLSGSYRDGTPIWKKRHTRHYAGYLQKLYGKVPEIKAIHAGLECGIIMGAYPKLDS